VDKHLMKDMTKEQKKRFKMLQAQLGRKA